MKDTSDKKEARIEKRESKDENKYVSKVVEVEAHQYASGEWKVICPNGDVQNLTDGAFKAKYDQKGHKARKDDKGEDKIAEKGDRLVDGTVQDKQPAGHPQPVNGKNAIGSGDFRNDAGVEGKQFPSKEVPHDERADEVKSADAGKLVDGAEGDEGARVKIGEKTKNDPIAAAEDKKAEKAR